jgi:UDP-N-acetylmuramyl pentapeptide phosphotransferase/UDP-N-acetylglucosamine-1-phosphate transferase
LGEGNKGIYKKCMIGSSCIKYEPFKIVYKKLKFVLQVAESLGLISAVVFLVLSAISLPIMEISGLALMCGALLTISSAAFLGFADDVLNLRWRHKLWAPGKVI